MKLRYRLMLGLSGAVTAAALGPLACIATSPTGIHRHTDGTGGSDGDIDPGTGTTSTTPIDPGNKDPHATVGCEPSHGPFLGGQRVLVRGRGFGSDVRVWFGDAEADPKSLVTVDDTRVQVTAPPGTAGAVDIATQNGDDASTRRLLNGGYVYDAAYAVPSEGPTSGGTKIEVIGQGTHFDATTVVKIDNKPCDKIEVQNETTLSCTVPPGTAGSKTLQVKTGDEAILVLDAYNYADSDNGFKGGLDGAPLAGNLKVLIFDNYTGEPVPGSLAIVGTDMATALVQQADASGVVAFNDPSLTAPVTVTATGKCHSPTTFVDVPVDTMTVYLDPVLTPECAAMGDPPPVGGKGSLSGYVKGELVWEGGVEFKKAPWNTVPLPINDKEHQAAYIFYATTDATATFYLPPEGYKVTPDSPGDVGYQYSMPIPAGNRALYALAGVEDRSVYPNKFTAYAMGVVKGVPVVPNDSTENVYISMSKTLDQALTLDIDGPTPGLKGPDRLRATVSVQLGNDGFAILPIGQKTPLLPYSGPLPFVGLPALDGDLYGSTYYATARAATGQVAATPVSAVNRILATSTAAPVPVNGFVGVPTLLTPAPNDAWTGQHLAAQFGPGAVPQISVYDITSGNGLVHWLIAVPAANHDIDLPDLSAYAADNAALPPGPVVVSLMGGVFDTFDYAKLGYRNLRSSGTKAYAVDTFPAHIDQ